MLQGEFSEHSSSKLKNRIEQIVSHEGEIAKKMERCVEQQNRLAQLVGVRNSTESITVELSSKFSWKRLSNSWDQPNSGIAIST